MEAASRPSEPLHALAWAVLAFSAILIRAIWTLAPMALEPIREHTLSTVQIILYIAWVIFMAYSEGYKGFQRQLAPRFAVRGVYAGHSGRPLLVILAPLFCMGLFHATRRRLIIAWSVLIGVIVLIVAVRQFDQPWRGIIDGGVVVGLTWGVIAIWYYAILALIGRPPDVTADVPDEPA